jgi:hypothetical protein
LACSQQPLYRVLPSDNGPWCLADPIDPHSGAPAPLGAPAPVGAPAPSSAPAPTTSAPASDLAALGSATSEGAPCRLPARPQAPARVFPTAAVCRAAGFEQLAKFLSKPLRNASAPAGHAGAEADLDASAFMIPITLRFPANATSAQAAAAPSAAAAGRRLLQAACNPGDRLCVPIDNTFDLLCERPAPSFHHVRAS